MMESEYDKTIKSTRYKLFKRYIWPVAGRFEISQKDWFTAKLAFKCGEIAFKLASWITIVGLFKLVADTTQSTIAYVTYLILNTILFCTCIYAIGAINFKFISESRGWHKYFNFLINFLLFALAFWAIQAMLSSVVKDIQSMR